VAGLAAAVFFLLVPIVASAGAIVAGWGAYANLRARADSENPGPQSFGRFLVYPGIVFTPIVFGFVLWLLSRPVASQIDSANPPPGAVIADLLLFDAGISFAIVVVLALASQAWIARARMAQFVGADFGRVEPLIVMPEIASILALILVFLILSRAEGLIGMPAPSAVTVDSAVYSLQVFSVASIALLLGAVLSNQVEDLKGRGFLWALVRAEVGVVVVIIFFIFAYLQLENF
jgi:hypothetical protein